MPHEFSANLGFLWNNLPLADGIRAAHAAGFDAVECHWPYDQPVDSVRAALLETGLPMLGLNTSRGDVEGGENGLSALPGRQKEAQRAINEAIDYGVAIGTDAVHVMAGFAQGPEAEDTFLENLAYADDRAKGTELTLLIEPLNHHDAPGYFLQTCEQATELIEKLGRARVKLMFDCYHLQIMGGDITRRLETSLSHIGHIQIASVPARAEPDRGELDYRHILSELTRLGYDRPVGAEYKPANGDTDTGLSWMEPMRVY